jgi:3-hydroxyacyl-CoA dehydrogenase/enoyl-CoA hydratase/3-hydroxybutyryl-CoA epimerase
MELISGGLGYEGFGALQFVVEAVVEQMEVKKAVLAEVEGRIPEDCILTSNTSTLSIDEMARGLARPESFCGMHFFNPVHRMPLVEVIRGRLTGDRAAAAVYDLSLRLGKVPVIVRDGPGFLVNRILAPYLNEACFLLGEGCGINAIDGAALDFGMPMGPLRLIDEVGVDVLGHAAETLHRALGPRLEPAPALLALRESGRLGRKGSSGFYLYHGSKEHGQDESIYAELGLPAPSRRTPVGRKQIGMRLILSMLNEAARTLEDGIVDTASAVDLGVIMGTGFPPFRGGRLRYADQIHARAILDRLTEYLEPIGHRFEPAPLLRQLASEDRGFYAAFPQGKR